MKGLMPGQKEPGMLDEFNDQCSLTKKQRLYGFGGCIAVGILFSFIGTLMLMSHNLEGFGVTYSLGNFISLAGTSFLIGPCRQCRQMFAKKRAVATCIYLGSLILTIVVAVETDIVPLVFLLIIVQWMALVWYSASYIPFGRAAIKKFFKNCFSC